MEDPLRQPYCGCEDDGVTVPTPAEIRDSLFEAVTKDLLGPADGPDEEIAGTSVSDRYLVGQLAPRGMAIEPEEVDDVPGDADGGREEGQSEVVTPQARTLMPSSIGFTFAVAPSVGELVATAAWGRYERTASEILETDAGNPKTVWKRHAMTGDVPLELRPGAIERIAPVTEQPDVVLEGTVRQLTDGRRIVTLFLINEQPEPDELKDAAWVFQPEISVRASDGSPIFVRRAGEEALGGDELDAQERALLAMQYRDHVEFAVGHGTSVHAEVDPKDRQRATALSTRVVPWYDVPATETPTEKEFKELAGLVLDMKELSELGTSELVETLSVLPRAYESWIEERETEAADDPGLAAFEEPASIAIAACRNALRRLREGVTTIERDLNAAAAFRFANEAMYLQRVHSEFALRRRRGEEVSLDDLDVPGNRSWRPFQLAFVLVALPGLTDPKHPDRSHATEAIVDLLWFPTGGGKT